MKRIVASIGLVAVGASGLQAGLMTAPDKPWNVSATLRGFYDDNVSGIPDDVSPPPGSKRDSYGVEVSPSLQFSFPWEQTTLSFGYVYSYKYYENKPVNNTDHDDMTHDFHVALNHAFSERYQLNVRDSLVIGQEPDMLRAGNTYNTFQRVSGDNIRNYGAIVFSAMLTPELGLEVGYANTYYSYSDNQNNINGVFTGPSNSGLMDQLDSEAHIDLRYQLQPQTIGIVGYQFREVDYIGNQQIGIDPATGGKIMSDERNARMHYGYVGLDHNFRPDLTGSVRVGGYYSDYYNDPNSQNSGSPYAMLSLQYTYLPESFVQFGFTYDYSTSDAFAPDKDGNLTLNAESASVYATVRHRITPKLYGTIIAEYQNSTYYGGAIDGDADNYYIVGLNLQYRFTPNFSVETGYNYDKLDSYTDPNGFNRSYDRNRVYIGVTASY
jgi:hypothetical protein